MQLKSPSKLFLVLGIIFALVATTLSLLSKNVIVINDENLRIISDHQIKTITTTTNFGNSEFGALAMAIISASCFIIAGSIMKDKK